MSATDELRKLLDECGVEWESEDCPGIDGKVVYRYTCWGDGGSCYYCEPIGAEPGTLGATCDVTHHHEPTVEDVLREFVERWHDTHHDDIPALFSEYAAKLMMRSDHE